MSRGPDLLICASGVCLGQAIIQRAGGKYQFMPGAWAGYGVYASAQDAPESVQDEKFQQVYAGGAGSSHWGC